VTVWDKTDKRVVVFEEQFEVRPTDPELTCTNPQLLEKDSFQLLTNGSLFIMPTNVSNTNRILTEVEFCIIPTVKLLNKIGILSSNLISRKGRT
jgi:hypothetical protein